MLASDLPEDGVPNFNELDADVFSGVASLEDDVFTIVIFCDFDVLTIPFPNSHDSVFKWLTKIS